MPQTEFSILFQHSLLKCQQGIAIGNISN